MEKGYESTCQLWKLRKLSIKSILISVSMTLAGGLHAQSTTFNDLKLFLAQEATVVEESENTVQYEYDELTVYLIVDEVANRMRLISPIVEENKLADEDRSLLLSVNFDRALDAKYAISNGVLWSVYAHPLRELYRDQAVDAFKQVASLVFNYGTSYSSTDVVFGGGE
ncbi:MAG: hypothetical protein AAF616_06160 [Bacteroidota bacterium]